MQINASLLLLLLVSGAYSLCITHTDCNSCITSSSDTGTACVYCLDKHSCHDPVTAAFSTGCNQIQFNQAQCNSGSYVAPGNTQRVVTYDTDVTGYIASLYSTSISNQNANVVELSAVKGHWLALSDFNNNPAIVLKALSSSSAIGSEYYAFAFVFQAVQEWNDSNADGNVDTNELIGNPIRFNDNGYSWTFANGQNGNIFSLSISGSKTNGPTLLVTCYIGAKDSVYNGFNLTGHNAKCDITVTGLTLVNKTDSWALRFFFVGKTTNIFLTHQPVTSVPGGQGINVGAGGSISWVTHATLGGVNAQIVFGGTTAASGTWGGKSFVDAVEANFGFPNPTPGSDYDIVWDPILSAPDQSGIASLIPSLAILAFVLALL